MYGHDAMEVQEAFTKIREQAKTFLLQPELLGCGLNLVNTQNLNYFQPHYQAEIFRLKGVLPPGRAYDDFAKSAPSLKYMDPRKSNFGISDFGPLYKDSSKKQSLEC